MPPRSSASVSTHNQHVDVDDFRIDGDLPVAPERNHDLRVLVHGEVARQPRQLEIGRRVLLVAVVLEPHSLGGRQGRLCRERQGSEERVMNKSLLP